MKSIRRGAWRASLLGVSSLFGVFLSTAPPAQAGVITARVALVSSENVAGLNRDADNTVNGSGLTGNGGAGSTHAEGENGIVWTTVGTLGPGTDYDPYITYDLGAAYDVTTIREWGYNVAFLTYSSRLAKVGPKDIDVYTSSDGISYGWATNVTFSFAPGTNGYPGHTLAVNLPGARYIKFDILNNHDGAIFDGTGTTRGGDGRSLTGLSEVRFEGTLTPPPTNAVNNPIPANNATGIDPDTALSWDANDADGVAIRYDVILGVGQTVYGYIVETASVATSTSARITWQPPTHVIQTGTPFWWRVEKVGVAGTVTSPVWTFTTRAETLTERDARMGWFREGKLYGAIVWGLYSGAEGVWPPQTGTKTSSWTYAEWMQYWKNLDTLTYRDTLQPYLTGDSFSATQMAHLCKSAGMEMVYVMPRHHDGYAIWNTATTTLLATNGFKIANSPYNLSKRDYLKELVDALHAEGLRVGFYFSLGDWHHPDFPHDNVKWAHPNAGVADPAGHTEVWADYVTYLHQQVREIVDPDTGTDYGHFDVVYFDYSSSAINGEQWGATKLVHMVRRYQPNIIINNRLWNGLANTNGDFSTPEASVDQVGYNTYTREWEAIMSANNPPTWGYGRPDYYPFKTASNLVWDIVDVASKGGLIELSVSPKGDGSLHTNQLSQYAGLGAWMATNAASVKGTTANPAGYRPAWGEFTSKRGENRLFLHVFSRPSDGNVVATGLYGTVRSAWLMANPTQSLTVTRSADGFQVALPAGAVDPIDTVIVADYEFPPPAVTVYAVSSENVLGLDRDANRTIDSSGFSSNSMGAVHGTNENGQVWTTVGSLGPGTDYAPSITYDLGERCNIQGICEWGYNVGLITTNGSFTRIGPKDVDVYTSSDGVSFTLAGSVQFAQATGSSNYLGNTIAVNLHDVRYIRLNIRTTYDGAVFDGTGSTPGTDGRNLTGLSEIRFQRGSAGTPVTLRPSVMGGASFQLRGDGLDRSWRYRLMRATDLRDGFTNVVDGPRIPSETIDMFTDPAPPGGMVIYRVEGAP